jgi:hypothetical protein
MLGGPKSMTNFNGETNYTNSQSNPTIRRLWKKDVGARRTRTLRYR